ncbi:MAG: NAD(P)H-dependent oxidoreductase [Cyanobacteriota bacterium]
MVLTPSSYGLQPWRFLVVQDPDLRSRLRPHAWNQAQITDSSHLVVFLVRRSIAATDLDRLIDRMASLRGTPSERLQGYRQAMAKDLIDGPRSQVINTWASNQVYIALGNFMTAAALLNVDTCAIEGFSPSEFDRLLDLEQSDYRSAVVCAAGYRDPADAYASQAKVRYEASELITRL